MLQSAQQQTAVSALISLLALAVASAAAPDAQPVLPPAKLVAAFDPPQQSGLPYLGVPVTLRLTNPGPRPVWLSDPERSRHGQQWRIERANGEADGAADGLTQPNLPGSFPGPPLVVEPGQSWVVTATLRPYLQSGWPPGVYRVRLDLTYHTGHPPAPGGPAQDEPTATQPLTAQAELMLSLPLPTATADRLAVEAWQTCGLDRQRVWLQDLRQPVPLAQRVVAQATAIDRLVWSQVSMPVQEAARVDGADAVALLLQPQGPPGPDGSRPGNALVLALNRVIAAEPLLPERMGLPPEVLRLAEFRDRVEALPSARRNRALLSLAYPELLAASPELPWLLSPGSPYGFAGLHGAVAWLITDERPEEALELLQWLREQTNDQDPLGLFGIAYGLALLGADDQALALTDRLEPHEADDVRRAIERRRAQPADLP